MEIIKITSALLIIFFIVCYLYLFYKATDLIRTKSNKEVNSNLNLVQLPLIERDMADLLESVIELRQNTPADTASYKNKMLEAERLVSKRNNTKPITQDGSARDCKGFFLVGN